MMKRWESFNYDNTLDESDDGEYYLCEDVDRVIDELRAELRAEIATEHSARIAAEQEAEESRIQLAGARELIATLTRQADAATDKIEAAQLAAERYRGSKCEECAGLVDAVLGALK